jgi:predicted  nucleic acid-binding Zn-ribbon protein
MNDAADLVALLEADRWLDKVLSQRSHLPELVALRELDARLTQLSADLRAAEALRAPLAEEFRLATEQADTLRRRRDELTRRINAPSTAAKDVAALDVELRHLDDIVSAAEDREVEALLAVEPAEETVATIKAEGSPLVHQRHELDATVKELQSSLDEELADLRSRREVTSRRLDGATLTKYESILKRVGTSGAAQVVDGRCDGCRIALAPLDRDRWKASAMTSLFSCPECGRLLIPCSS